MARTDTDLRTAAARFYLGLDSTGYLVDVAHAALDSGIYAHGLGEIATLRQPNFADIRPLFESALTELNIQISGREQAIDILAESYMEWLAEGGTPPQETTRQAYSDYMVFLNDPRANRRDPEYSRPFEQMMNLYWSYDAHRRDHLSFEELDLLCIKEAQKWCWERWLPQFDPSWRTSTVVALAQQMYESRDFSAMPMLADALQDAGCDNDDILMHCRDANGVHVRGCWVVDLVLGKS